MNFLTKAFLFILLFQLSVFAIAQELPFQQVKISVSPEIRPSFVKGGRVLLYFTTKAGKEPRNNSEVTIGITPTGWNPAATCTVDSGDKNILHTDLAEGFIPVPHKYYYQAVYKQNIDDGQINIPGNMVSNIDSVEISGPATLNLRLIKVIPPYKIVENKFVKPVVMKSKFLSEFWGRERDLKASILLPSGYFENPGKSYPICYHAPGLNGRYTGVNGMMANKDFSQWWFSGNAPQVIYVFLDSQGPYGDSYQVDSENNGPFGKALTEELIPEIEKLVHYNKETHMRFLAGASTGGWVVLGLQIFYPDFFDGAWAYSPDPVDFEHYGLINFTVTRVLLSTVLDTFSPNRAQFMANPKDLCRRQSWMRM